MPDLAEMTAAAFATGGPIAEVMAAHGRRYVRQDPQVDYANRVARAFSTPAGERGLVALLDAETGIGKSIGYLVPMGLAVAPGRIRGVVSTFTLLLQRQILSEDFPIAADVVRAITGRIVRAAPRLGLGNFIAPSRVLDLRQALADARASDDTAAVLESMTNDKLGDGTIRSWTERNGPLPPGIQESDICLVSSEGEDAEAFRAHLQQAADADVVVVTHAMMARSMLRWNSLLSGMGEDDMPPFAVGVVDEADRLPHVAADVFTVKLSIPTLRSLGESIPGAIGRNLMRTVNEAGDWFDEVRPRTPNVGGRHSHGDVIGLGNVSSAPLRNDARGHARAISDALTKAGAKLAADDAATVKSMAIELAHFADACEDMSDNQVPALRWSPVRAYPGFSIVPLKPGNLCGRLWNATAEKPPFLRSLVMTSATLDALGSPRPFHQFKSSIGLLGDNFSAELSGSFAPRRFGKLSFVFPDPTTPPPTRRNYGDDDVEENPTATDAAWLLYATQGVAAAASRGGRCLVLTTSFRDTEAMCTLLRGFGHSPIEHKRGQRLIDSIDAFRLDKAGILLSPAAWEGVNLPGLLSHLVIPRIPFAPLDTAERQAMLDSLISKGWDQKQAKATFFRTAVYEAQRRLRQGLGRAIRSATDDVTAWILDPRFPLPQEVAQRENLIGVGRPMVGFEFCVPVRFRVGLRPTFAAGEIFYPLRGQCSIQSRA
jgi:ATP-dependent DNA helicase DinG